jgi:hypothetical protein
VVEITHDKAITTYWSMITAYPVGLARLYLARAAALSFKIAHGLATKGIPQSPPDRSPHHALSELLSVAAAEAAAFDDVWGISELVYATAIIDTFLADTTTFLFLISPPSMGKEKTITLEGLLEAGSVEASVTQMAARRSREVSFKSLPDRVDFLVSTFGLTLNLDGRTRNAISKLPVLRNALVHDQGMFDPLLVRIGVVGLSPKVGGMKTQVTGEDLKEAVLAYLILFREVASSVLLQVLHAPTDHPAVLSVLEVQDSIDIIDKAPPDGDL